MAYTNSPQNNTYKTVDIKFDGTPYYRSGDLTVQRDSQIVNMYYDRVGQENKERNVRLKKRPGLTTTSYSLSKATSDSDIRGSFYDPDQNTMYWAVDNKVYSVSPDSGTSTRTVATLATSSGYVGFCSYLKSDNTRYVCFTDGEDLWIDNFASLSCSKVTDPDLPTPHQPYPLYLDGYIFLIGENSGDIYNSDNDDPTSWTASEFIQAEISSDLAIRLYKAKNYIVCMGYNSVEFFWDAGNETGSPLSRNDSPIKELGYVTAGAQTSDAIYFVGQDTRKNLGVYMLDGFKFEKVSNTIVERTLTDFSSTPNTKGGATLATDGHIVSVDGHTFYVLPTSQTTWAYDIEEKMWYEWKNSNNTGLKVQAVWGMYNGGCYMAIEGQGVISMFSPAVYQDFGTNFTCRYTTEDNSFDTFNWKICHRVALLCSMHNYTGTSNAVISWSDNDWGDGGTTGRNINVFSSSPFIVRCGKFRNRSFRVEYADNYPFFMTGLQLDINVLGI